MSKLLSRAAAVLAATALTLGLGACTSGSTATPSAESAAASADVKQLTVSPGKLTIATGEPAYSPWVEDNDPASGKGFEAAVAYAVAEELGFSKDEVVWTRSTFDEAIAPGPKSWDFNLQQFSITEERKKAVDFSSSYYITTQAVLTYKGSPVADAASIADLKSAKFGVAIGTTSQTALTNLIAPTSEPKVFNNNDDLVQALKTKQIEALVVDLPTALYLSNAVIDNGLIVGQLADNTGGDEFGLVLQKGSKLTEPVSLAIAGLASDGVLEELQQEWLSDSIKVPVLS